MVATLLFTAFTTLFLSALGIAMIIVCLPPQRLSRRRARAAFWKALSVPTVLGLVGSLGMFGTYWFS